MSEGPLPQWLVDEILGRDLPVVDGCGPTPCPPLVEGTIEEMLGGTARFVGDDE